MSISIQIESSKHHSLFRLLILASVIEEIERLSKMEKGFLFFILTTFSAFPFSQVDASDKDGNLSDPNKKGIDLCIFI